MAKQVQIASKQAHNFTFGIEIETLMPRGLIRIGGYRSGAQIPGLPQGWNAHTDCSLSTSLSGYQPMEIVSPILKGAEGLRQVLQVAEWMNANGFKTNRSCGTHVHVGVESVAGRMPNAQQKWVGNLTNVVAQFEQAIRGAAGSAQRVNGRWCQSIRNEQNKQAAERVRKGQASHVRGGTINNGGRYHLLNLQNVNGTRLNTVEFRAFSGTTEGLKMVAWVSMCLAMCERALGRKATWDRTDTKAYETKTTGEARKAINRFFCLMGWKLGRKDSGKPECDAFGIIDLEQVAEYRKELRRLCTKFDKQSAA